MILGAGLENAFADNRLEPIPALDIEEILDERLWEKSPLTREQRSDLEEGIKFLDLVLRGRTMVEKTATEGVVSGDLSAIKAYNLVSRAYRQFPIAADSDFQMTIRSTSDVLRQILDKRESKEVQIDEKQVEIASNLFSLLSTLSFER